MTAREEIGRPGVPDEATILEGIATVAREQLHWQGEIDPELRLVETLGLDSLRLLTLVIELENHFRICLEEGSEEGVETVADLVGIIRGQLEQQATNDR